MAADTSSIGIISQAITLPCGLKLPNRLVKCPMQETQAKPPYFDPPIETFQNLYTEWATAQYGLIITGQVQIDLRFLSIAGDVVCHEDSAHDPVLGQWKEWARIAKSGGSPCIVQLAHPGRMSPSGAGVRPSDMQTLCPSSVPVQLGDSWLDKLAQDRILGTPKEMTLHDIDEVVDMWKRGAIVARDAGFDGIQLHGAHGFLLSEFLSPHTNRREDDYGGTPHKRMKLLRRLVDETRDLLPPPLCLAVKLNSADYMEKGGLTQEEGLEQVRWLLECGKVDFIEISGGNAEQKTSGLHNSFAKKTMDKAPKRAESTRIREAFFTDFAEKVQDLKARNGSTVPIQLSGGFRSRVGMADAIDSGVTDLIGLGRAAVLEPSLPRSVLLNPDIADESAIGMSHIVRGMWFAKMIPFKIVGRGLGLKFFYHQMRRLGRGLESDPNLSIPWMIVADLQEALRTSISGTVMRLLQGLPLVKVYDKTE